MNGPCWTERNLLQLLGRVEYITFELPTTKPRSILSSASTNKPLLRSTRKTPKNFVKFGKLPMELQLVIWEIARDTAVRRVLVGRSHSGDPCHSKSERSGAYVHRFKFLVHPWSLTRINMDEDIATPALLHTCHVSRLVARKKYQRFEPMEIPQNIRLEYPWLNPSRQCCWIGDQDVIEIYRAYGSCGRLICRGIDYATLSTPNLTNISSARTLLIRWEQWPRELMISLVMHRLAFRNLKDIIITIHERWTDWTAYVNTGGKGVLEGMKNYLDAGEIKEKMLITCYDDRVVLEEKPESLKEDEQPLRITCMAAQNLQRYLN